MTIVKTPVMRAPKTGSLATGTITFRSPVDQPALDGTYLARNLGTPIALVNGVLPDTELPAVVLEAKLKITGSYRADEPLWRPFKVPTSGPANLLDLLDLSTVYPAPVVGQAQAAAQQAATYRDQAQAAAASVPSDLPAQLTAKADLQGGKLNPTQLPDLALIDYLGAVVSQAAMLALTGQKGDWCVRTDTSTEWRITGSNPAQLSSWTQLPLSTQALTKPVADQSYATRKAFAAASTGATATLAPGAFDQVDASGGSKVRKLAAGVTASDEITVKVTAISGTNTVTIQGDTGVTASTIILTALNQAVTFSWTGSAWVVSGRDNPTTYLNATFAPIRQDYVALARTPDVLIAGAITRDANGAATSAPVAWPDGTPGTYTATTVSTAFPGAVDAYTVTYGSPVTKTYTQPAVTRDATSGAVTQAPAIVVS